MKDNIMTTMTDEEQAAFKADTIDGLKVANEAISLENARSSNLRAIPGGNAFAGNTLGAAIGGPYLGVPDGTIRDLALRAAADMGGRGRPIDEIIADARKIVDYVKGG